MIVSRAMADEAAFVFGFDLDCPMTEQHINDMYKSLVKKTHPDAGGSAEAFARVDRAKHVLLAWAAKPKAAAPDDKADPCPRCGGSGRITAQNGFKAALARQCPKCHGTGEVMDVDRTGDTL